MTEAEWLTSDNPEPMLTYLGDTASARKLRHFLVTCARRVLPACPDRDMSEALEVAERFADGNGTKSVLSRARTSLKSGHSARVSRWAPLYSDHIRSVPAWHATREQVVRAARDGAVCCAWANTRKKSPSGSIYMTYPAEELSAQAHLLRDIFGNPFRPVVVEPGWLTSTVVALARGVYEERAFDRLPVLADALQDAGCEHPDVLAHCREPGPHARGCWVVDLLLGFS